MRYQSMNQIHTDTTIQKGVTGPQNHYQLEADQVKFTSGRGRWGKLNEG